jgi:hypothetical protein
MTTPAALLAFFRQEASEHLDQLDRLLAGEAGEAPDGATFLAHTRALRGSAAMTRLGGLPEFAATVERVASGLRHAELRWDPRLHFAVRGALAELRALVTRADRWSEADQRAARTHSVAFAAVAAGYLSAAAPVLSPASPVLPIARLFPEDGLPGVIERNPAPPLTIAERFRQDIAAAADGIAREAAHLAAGERGPQSLALGDALRRALLGLSDVAESYGASSIATLSMRMARSPVERPAERLAIQSFAQLLMDRERSDPELAALVRQHTAAWPGDQSRGAGAAGGSGPGEGAEASPRLATPRGLSAASPAPQPVLPPRVGPPPLARTPVTVTPVTATTVTVTPVTVTPVTATPVTATPVAVTPVAATDAVVPIETLLAEEDTVTPPVAVTPVAVTPVAVTPVAVTPVAAPPVAVTPVAVTPVVVPIETLLYDGPAALDRARVVRDQLREAWARAGGTAVDPAIAALLDELSDLLDLASTG